MQSIEWIEWADGECPLEGRQTIEVRLRNGAIETMTAGRFDFKYSSEDTEFDIVAHRVLA